MKKLKTLFLFWRVQGSNFSLSNGFRRRRRNLAGDTKTKVETNALLNAVLSHKAKTRALTPLLQALIRWTLVALDLGVTLEQRA